MADGIHLSAEDSKYEIAKPGIVLEESVAVALFLSRLVVEYSQ
jgi:hypothetical protein